MRSCDTPDSCGYLEHHKYLGTPGAPQGKKYNMNSKGNYYKIG